MYKNRIKYILLKKKPKSQLMHQNDRLVPRYNKCIPKDPKIRINKVQKLRINRGYNKVELVIIFTRQ